LGKEFPFTGRSLSAVAGIIVLQTMAAELYRFYCKMQKWNFKM